MYDVYEIRKDFPELALTVNSRPNTYLDTAASALKPEAVVEKMMFFYRMHYSNVHRGAYYLSEQATAEYEKARETVARFVNAGSREIVFTRSATESPVTKFCFPKPNTMPIWCPGRWCAIKPAAL